MMEKLKKIAPWAVAAIISVISILVAFIIAERTETESRQEYEHYVDSLAVVRHSDSVSFSAEITRLTMEKNSLSSERDSIERKLSTQTSTTKVVYRTVYQDSVREVMVENTETASIYEERIAHVKDSLERIIAEKDGVSVQYVEKIVHDTIVQYVDRTDSVSVVTTIEKKDGPIGIYASGQAGYGTGGLIYGADLGVKYFFLGPVYGKAGVTYDGNVSGVIGIGMDIRF